MLTLRLCFFGITLFAPMLIRVTAQEGSDVENSELRGMIRLQEHKVSISNECTVRAIQRLGEFKTHEAAENLIPYLDFRRPATKAEVSNTDIRLHSQSEIYPATGALFSIGQPAVSTLITAIQADSLSPPARKNAVYAFMLINRADEVSAINLLRTAALRAADPKESVRLREAAKEALRMCRPAKKEACQGALDQP